MPVGQVEPLGQVVMPLRAGGDASQDGGAGGDRGVGGDASRDGGGTGDRGADGVGEIRSGAANGT
jgi:hypothetical protein